MAVLLGRFLPPWRAGVLSWGYVAALEAPQFLIPPRSAEGGDLLVNAVAVLGAAVLVSFRRPSTP